MSLSGARERSIALSSKAEKQILLSMDLYAVLLRSGTLCK
jgi:hypothetical protein